MATGRPLVGWPLLPLPDEEGRLRFPSTTFESVRSQLQIILATRPGELRHHPDFGVGLDLYREQVDSLSLRREIRERVTEQARRYEPRVEVLSVEVEPMPLEPRRLRVSILYRLQRTGTPGRLDATLNTDG